MPWHRHQQFDNLVLGTFSSSNEKLVSAKLWTTREINTGHTLDNFVAITCLKSDLNVEAMGNKQELVVQSLNSMKVEIFITV